MFTAAPIGGVVGVDSRAQCHVTGVHAHAHGEIGDAVLALCGIGLLTPGRHDGQAGTHGALGVVFAGFVHAERSLHAVTQEAQHAALVGLHDVGHAPHGRAQDGKRFLGIHTLGQGGGAHHVGEQHGHLPMLQAGRPQQAGQPRTQRGNGQLQHRVSQRCALGNECCNP